MSLFIKFVILKHASRVLCILLLDRGEKVSISCLYSGMPCRQEERKMPRGENFLPGKWKISSVQFFTSTF